MRNEADKPTNRKTDGQIYVHVYRGFNNNDMKMLFMSLSHLVLPSCYNEVGSLIGYFSARECCVEMEGSRSYRYGDRSFPCIGVLLAALVSVYFIHCNSPWICEDNIQCCRGGNIGHCF